MKTGLELITEERVKQITKHNYTAYHDEMYLNGELLYAALAYIIESLEGEGIHDWPWDEEFWHPGTYEENLQKAGALIAAELDRINIGKVS